MCHRLVKAKKKKNQQQQDFNGTIISQKLLSTLDNLEVTINNKAPAERVANFVSRASVI